MLSGEAANINIGFILLGLEPTICCTRGERATNYTSQMQNQVKCQINTCNTIHITDMPFSISFMYIHINYWKPYCHYERKNVKISVVCFIWPLSRVTQRVLRVKQELPSLPEYMSSITVYDEGRCCLFPVFCVCFRWLLFVSIWFYDTCLSFIHWITISHLVIFIKPVIDVGKTLNVMLLSPEWNRFRSYLMWIKNTGTKTQGGLQERFVDTKGGN